MAEADGNIFATLRRARRFWAVAAIHGEATRLNNLHDGLADRLKEGHGKPPYPRRHDAIEELV